MKSPWFTVAVVIAISFLWMPPADSAEPKESPTPAADPMRGKAPGEVRDDNGLKMKLVWCPPGAFTMEIAEVIAEPAVVEKGDKPVDDDEVDPKEDPEPQPTNKITPMKVFLTNGYWLGQCEVTQSEWKTVIKTEPWKGQELTKEGEDFPATYISWNDATNFCRKLTEQERQTGRLSKDWGYMLPTEAQWDRACRARTETKFSFGDEESKLADYAWFDTNAMRSGERFAHRAGQKKANPWGLYDMHGNVWEWCRDIYTEKLPGGRDPEVKTGAEPGTVDRVIRGGSWFTSAALCQSAYRFGSQPLDRSGNSTIGFRVALCSVR